MTIEQYVNNCSILSLYFGAGHSFSGADEDLCHENEMKFWKKKIKF